MICKILNLFCIGLVVSTQANTLELPKPYAEDSVNFMYNLLFCDELLICKHFRRQIFLFMREVQHGTHEEEKLRPMHSGLQASGR